jgi:hypothetical protein
MKLIGKLLRILGVTLAAIFVSVLILFVVSVIIVFAQITNYNTTVFNDTTYATIEQLHHDYIEALEFAYYNGDSSTDNYPKELVSYFEDGEDVMVVCTYSSNIGSEVKQDSLLVYIVKKTVDGYYLEIPSMGISSIYMAVIPLHSDYDHFTYDSSCVEYKTIEQKKCYGFAFKNASADYTLYFDGLKMKETECMNPFTGEEFILCYAASDKTYNVIESLITPQDERHTLEIK